VSRSSRSTYLPLPEEKKDRRSFLSEKRKGGFVHTGQALYTYLLTNERAEVLLQNAL